MGVGPSQAESEDQQRRPRELPQHEDRHLERTTVLHGPPPVDRQELLLPSPPEALRSQPEKGPEQPFGHRVDPGSNSFDRAAATSATRRFDSASATDRP